MCMDYITTANVGKKDKKVIRKASQDDFDKF